MPGLRHRPVLVYAALFALLLAVVTAALLLGQARLSDPGLATMLLELRAIRIAAAFVAGAALAMGGVVVQGVFRNPLVSPSILGTTAGSMLGGQVALLLLALVRPSLRGLPGLAPEMVVPLGCLVGAGLALAIVLAFCRERTGTLMLLLTGFILSSLFLSLGGFATSLSQDSWEVSRAVVAFTLGGVGGVGARQLAAGVPLVVAAGAAAWLWGRTLDVMLSGEEEATTLGVDVGQARRWCIAWVAALTAAAVSIGGNIGFVGLIVPHVMRPLVGVHHRRLLPAAGLAGGIFLVACDVIARTLPSRTELPLGVVTGVLGAPVFLILLARSARGMSHG